MEAKVIGRNLEVSTKHLVEIGSFIKGRKLINAKDLLSKVLEKKVAVPFKRFNKDVGHKKGRIAAGRYPYNASEEVIGLLNSLRANAEAKGLNEADLVINYFSASKGERRWHAGRHRRRKTKSTNVEIRVKEKEKKVEKEIKKEKPKKEEEKK
jgi:large subunit ribosomal protein L22